MDDYELADRAHALPDRLADRLEPRTLDHLRRHASGGAWDEEIDSLLAGLQKGGKTITAAEHDEIAALLDHMHMPHDRLNALKVTG